MEEVKAEEVLLDLLVEEVVLKDVADEVVADMLPETVVEVALVLVLEPLPDPATEDELRKPLVLQVVRDSVEEEVVLCHIVVDPLPLDSEADTYGLDKIADEIDVWVRLPPLELKLTGGLTHALIITVTTPLLPSLSL